MLKAMVASTAVLLGALGGIVSPAPAHSAADVETLTPQTPAIYLTAAGGRLKMTKDAPIRKCFQQECAVVSTEAVGVEMAWDHYAYNQQGHRWYYVTFAKPGNGGGWVYCGNTTAPC